jgi:SAM-dependent methyltransferase
MNEPLDETQAASAAQFDRQSDRYGKSHILADTRDLEEALRDVKAPPSGTALDVATGGGHAALFLLRRGWRVTAGDIAPRMLENAKRLAKEAGFELETNLFPAEAMPFPDRSFDLVCTRVAPHHFSSPERFVAEAVRVLKAGGCLVLIDGSVPDGDPETEAWLHQVEKWRDASHGRFLSRAAWEALVKGSGLAVELSQLMPAKQPDLQWYFETAATPAEDRARVLEAVRTAPNGVRAALRIGEEDGRIVWWWPRLILRARAPVPSPVLGRLRAARERLDAKDLAGAMAVYEEVLAAAGDRADVLVTISGDLGSTGHVSQIVELIAPRYDAARHGPATGINLLQAYIAVRDADSAQHILDVLFSLNRPDLEERLYGFSNAVSELFLQSPEGGHPPPVPPEPGEAAIRVGIVTVSRPVWHYGLESVSEPILPPKAGKLRRVAFTQLSLPGGYPDFEAAARRPADELGRLARALPAWFAEWFYYSAHYAPVSAVAYAEDPGGTRRQLLFPVDVTVEYLRQLVDSTPDGLDYAITGALRHKAGDYELVLRVWEVKKFRERKQFALRWTPASADAELAKLREAVGAFMEWTPVPPGSFVPCAVPASHRSWIDAIGGSQDLFLAEKGILPASLLPPADPAAAAFAAEAVRSPAAALGLLTLHARARGLGVSLEEPIPSALAAHPAVEAARKLLGL